MTNYYEQMQAHLDEGGKLSHLAAVDLLADNKKLREALEKIEPLAARLRMWGATGDDVWQIVNRALEENNQ